MADGPEFAALPLDAKRGLRCCLRCNLVKTFEQFVDDGCDNCPVLGMKDDQERVVDCTSRYVRVRPPPPYALLVSLFVRVQQLRRRGVVHGPLAQLGSALAARGQREAGRLRAALLRSAARGGRGGAARALGGLCEGSCSAWPRPLG